MKAMKKILICLLCVALIGLVVACGRSKTEEHPSGDGVINEAVDDVGDAVQDGVEDVEDGVRDMTNPR